MYRIHFAVPDGPGYCILAGNLEDAYGATWNEEGARIEDLDRDRLGKPDWAEEAASGRPVQLSRIPAAPPEDDPTDQPPNHKESP